MICPNCKTKINNNKNFCSKCGTKIDIEETNESCEEYLNAFLNTTKERINKEYISAPTLLFGPFFYIYKRMWSYSLYFFLIYILADLIPNPSLSILTKLVTNIIFALLYRYHYLKHAQKQIDKITNYNDNLSKKEMIKLCRVKGKSIDSKIIIIIILIYLGSIIILKTNPKENETIEPKKDNTILKMTYEIPDEFENKTYEDYYRYYTYNNDSEMCFITIKTPTQSTYNNAIDYLKETSKADTEYEAKEIQEIKTSNAVWNKLQLENIDSEKEYYALKYYNDIYEVTFESIYNKNICDQYKEKILKSIKFN